ncbi:MAG: ATP-binding protein [Clostridiales bacterium]|nr:ATP-binding protein [Clostridiales bacterium]
MNYQVDFYHRLYEKNYNDAIRANDSGNYALAYKKFLEAVDCLRKLSVLDPAKEYVYSQRAEKMLRIAGAIQAKAATQNTPQRPANANVSSSSINPTLGYTDNTQMQQTQTGEDMSQYYTFYSASDLVDGFDRVIGLQEAKEAITEYVINPIRYPQAYSYNFLSSKCILLEGPPGTGKTTFAKAVAKEIEQPFVLVNVAAMVNCYVGETGKIIDKVFSSLRDYVEKYNCGITIFFDEFDEIAKSRSGDDKASQTAVPALLRNLDGVKENKNFLVLANTNCKESLDSGILSRFRQRIYIPLPDKNMRVQFFKNKLAQLEPLYFEQLDLEVLAEQSEGLSGRAITQVCDDFLYVVGGIKAGIRACENLNEALLDIIRKQK